MLYLAQSCALLKLLTLSCRSMVPVRFYINYSKQASLYSTFCPPQVEKTGSDQWTTIQLKVIVILPEGSKTLETE